MKKRSILLILPILLVSCSSSKNIETNKEIKEKSTEIATSSDMLPPLIEVGASRSRILLNPVSTS